MTDTKNHTTTVASSLEGRVFRPASMAETAEAVELAFDYRGDVTIVLASGESVMGYLFNRLVAGPDSYIDVFPADRPMPRRIPYNEIATIAFTGEDTASGKSWEAWITKKDSERQAEIARIAQDAKTRGIL
jgi:hypothetical protein